MNRSSTIQSDPAACGAGDRPAPIDSPPPAPRPRHLSRPGASGWTWWRDAVLRSAGFPARLVRTFADDAAGRDADALTAAIDQERDARRELESGLRLLAMDLRRAPAASGRPEGASVDAAALRRAEKALARGELDATAAAVLPAASQARWRSAVDRLATARRAFDAAYTQAAERLMQTTAKLAADPLLRAAVTWQNHNAVVTAFDPLVRDEAMPGSKRRQREALLANYVQRYAVKNDTIGFFGPMTWVRLAGADEAGTFEAGPNLVRASSLHFEDWAIQLVADGLAADDRYLPWLVARIQPFLRLDRGSLRMPGGDTIPLTEPDRQLLSMCDGQRSVRAIAAALLANPFGHFGAPDEIQRRLRQLQKEQRISLSLGLPTTVGDPDLALGDALQAVDDIGLREQAMALLRRLQAARDAVGDARGDADRLVEAMTGLDDAFRDMTGAETRRRHGEVYGGRGLIYEDCHRDLALELPEESIRPLRDALELVVTGARWFTSEAATAFGRRFDAIYDVLASRSDTPGRVAFPDFWLEIQSFVFGEEPALESLARQLRAHWEDILQPFAEAGCRRVDRSVESIRDRVHDLFGTRDAGWSIARYQCPDVMFCAASPQALLDGEYLAVLGEVHIGGNTLAANLFASQHPDRAGLLQNLRTDLGDRYIIPKLSPDASKTPIRTQWPSDPHGIREILFSKDLVPANPKTALSIGQLTLAREDGVLVVRNAAGGERVGDLQDVVGDFMFLAVINRFGVLTKRRHTPRVTIGRLVVQRETWCIDAVEAGLALDADEATCFRRLRAFAGALGIPSSVFVKVAWEDKPFHLDFDSPIFVRMFAKQLRNALDAGLAQGTVVAFSEMLPDFDDLWLRDASGQAFTAELRLVGLHVDDLGR
jgi:hypothetical protein